MKNLLSTLVAFVAVVSLMGLSPVLAAPCQPDAHDQSSCTTGPGQKILTGFYTTSGDSNADAPQNFDIPLMPSAGGGGAAERDSISTASPVLGDMDGIVYTFLAALLAVFLIILIPIVRRLKKSRRY